MFALLERSLAGGIDEVRLSYEQWGVLANERTSGKRGKGDFLKKPFTLRAGTYGDHRAGRDGYRVEVEIVTPGERRGSGAGMVARFYEGSADEPCVIVPKGRARSAAQEEYAHAVRRSEQYADLERRVAEMRTGIEAMEVAVVEKRRMRRDVNAIAARAREAIAGLGLSGEARFRAELRAFADAWWAPRRPKMRSEKITDPVTLREELKRVLRKP